MQESSSKNSDENVLSSDDEVYEDLFAGNLMRYQALKQNSTALFGVGSPSLSTGLDHSVGTLPAAKLPRVELDDQLDDDDENNNRNNRKTNGTHTDSASPKFSLESVLRELEPDNISPQGSPLRKKCCYDDERVRWALEPLPDEELGSEVVVNNVKCAKVCDNSDDDVLLVIGNTGQHSEQQPVSSNTARVMVNVRVGAKMVRQPLYQEDRLDVVFERVAREASIAQRLVCLAVGDRTIEPHQTPAQLQLKSADVLEFWPVSERQCVPADESVTAAQSAPSGGGGGDTLTLKLQSACRRASLMLTADRDAPLAGLMKRYATQRGVALHQLRFCFDGDCLTGDETPQSLDLDGGECIDVFDIT